VYAVDGVTVSEGDKRNDVPILCLVRVLSLHSLIVSSGVYARHEVLRVDWYWLGRAFGVVGNPVEIKNKDESQGKRTRRPGIGLRRERTAFGSSGHHGELPPASCDGLSKQPSFAGVVRAGFCTESVAEDSGMS
jgi:hypothetical protein